MSYTISSVIDGVTRQLLGGYYPGALYQLVTQSSSVFNITTEGIDWIIQDESVNPPLFASYVSQGFLATDFSSSPWLIVVQSGETWVPISNISDLPVDKNIPIAIAYIVPSPVGALPTYKWWYANIPPTPQYPIQINLYSSTVPNPPLTNEQYYMFYISTYNNVVTGSYNVLASSGSPTTATNIQKRKIISSAIDPNIGRESILLDFEKFPDVTVATSRLCSPLSVQTYKGYKISPTEFFFTENQTNIDIALESGNMQPNFIVLKSFNKNHAHFVKFKDSYLFISKESGISAATLENINTINNNNGYPTMYPLRNAINCPNGTNPIELYYNSHIIPGQR